VIGSPVETATVSPSGRFVVERCQKLCVTGFAVLSGLTDGAFSKGEYSAVFENRDMVFLFHGYRLGERAEGVKINFAFSFERE